MWNWRSIHHQQVFVRIFHGPCRVLSHSHVQLYARHPQSSASWYIFVQLTADCSLVMLPYFPKNHGSYWLFRKLSIAINHHQTKQHTPLIPLSLEDGLILDQHFTIHLYPLVVSDVCHKPETWMVHVDCWSICLFINMKPSTDYWLVFISYKFSQSTKQSIPNIKPTASYFCWSDILNYH